METISLQRLLGGLGSSRSNFSLKDIHQLSFCWAHWHHLPGPTFTPDSEGREGNKEVATKNPCSYCNTTPGAKGATASHCHAAFGILLAVGMDRGTSCTRPHGQGMVRDQHPAGCKSHRPHVPVFGLLLPKSSAGLCRASLLWDKPDNHCLVQRNTSREKIVPSPDSEGNTGPVWLRGEECSIVFIYLKKSQEVIQWPWMRNGQAQSCHGLCLWGRSPQGLPASPPGWPEQGPRAPGKPRFWIKHVETFSVKAPQRSGRGEPEQLNVLGHSILRSLGPGCPGQAGYRDRPSYQARLQAMSPLMATNNMATWPCLGMARGKRQTPKGSQNQQKRKG
ncbi:Cysteine-Rich Secretory Protein Lccl Domain-Containing 2 [Manis pentadactyla]|nr:Cysteine-Rich Secretory Protein Lccl Domain-Containing 2 [Manis pentadactyla]